MASLSATPCFKMSTEHTFVASSTSDFQDSLCSAGAGPGLPQGCLKGLAIKGPVQNIIYVCHMVPASELHVALFRLAAL